MTPTPRWPAAGNCAPRSTETPDPVGVLVVADGANTLTERAPGGYDPDAADAQRTSTTRWPTATSPP